MKKTHTAKKPAVAQKHAIAVIGAGRIGKLHVENIKAHIKDYYIKWLVEPAHKEMRKWIDEMQIPNVSEKLQPAINDKEVKAVVICSSADTHLEFIEQSAKKGKAIFCEKPLAVDLAKTKKTLKIVKDSGVLLQVGFNRRFDHEFSHLKEKIKEIGSLQLIKITSRDPAPPPYSYIKRSGGMFLDMSIHDFDMVRFLSGSEVVEVSVMADCLVDRKIAKYDDVDTALISLKLKNGTMALIDNCRKAIYGYDQRIEVFGSKGMAIASNRQESLVETFSEKGKKGEKLLYFFLERYSNSFVTEMKSFFASVDNPKRGVAVSGDDGLKPLAIGLAVQKALKEKRTVRLAEIS